MIIFQFFCVSRTKPENKSMSTSFLYHGFGLRDYYYKTTRFIGGILTFEITPKPEAIKCPECDSRSVIKKGVIKRDLRTIPVGSKPVILRTVIQRVWCPICQFIRQIKLSFSQEGKSYTRSFERYVLELSQFMTIKDIADHLRISWDTIKQIQKAHLQKRYRSIPLKKVRQIAIDEISIGKGHQYLTIVMDLESGRILHVGDGKGGDALNPFWKKVKISKAKIKAISIDMGVALLHFQKFLQYFAFVPFKKL
jgi:transposase